MSQTLFGETLPEWVYQEGYIDSVRKSRFYDYVCNQILNARYKYQCHHLISGYQQAITKDFLSIQRQLGPIKIIGDGELLVFHMLNLTVSEPSVYESDGTFRPLDDREAESRGLSLMNRVHVYAVLALFCTRQPEHHSEKLQKHYALASKQCAITDMEKTTYPYLSRYTINPRMPLLLVPAMLGGPTSSSWYKFDSKWSCPQDIYGSYCINGNRRIIIGDWCTRVNSIFVYKKKDGRNRFIKSELRSDNTNVFRSTSTLVMLLQPCNKMQRHQILINIPYVREKVPLSHVFRALGWKDDWDFTTEENDTIPNGKSVEEKIYDWIAIQLGKFFEINHLPIDFHPELNDDQVLMEALHKNKCTIQQKMSLREILLILRSSLPPKETLWTCQRLICDEKQVFSSCPRNISNEKSCSCTPDERRYQSCHRINCRCWASRFYQASGASLIAEKNSQDGGRFPTQITRLKSSRRVRAGQRPAVPSSEAALLYISLRSDDPNRNRKQHNTTNNQTIEDPSNPTSSAPSTNTLNRKRSRIHFEGDDGGPLLQKLNALERLKYCPIYLAEQKMIFNARRTILKEICPHVAISGAYRKLSEHEINEMKSELMLTMLERILLTMGGHLEQSSKDDASCRAVEDSSVILPMFFRKNMRLAIKSFQRHLRNRLDSNSRLCLADLGADESMTRKWKTSFTTGMLSEGPRQQPHQQNNAKQSTSIIQMLNSTNKMFVYIHSNRTSNKVNTRGKESESRSVHNDDRHFDLSWTPDGRLAGLTRTKPMAFDRACGTQDTFIIELLIRHLRVLPHNTELSHDIWQKAYEEGEKNMYGSLWNERQAEKAIPVRVFVNGKVVGQHAHGPQLIKWVDALRATRIINRQVACYMKSVSKKDPFMLVVMIETQLGRCISTLFVSANVLLFNKIYGGDKALRILASNEYHRLNLVEDIDIAKEGTLATSLDDYLKKKAMGIECTHTILHPVMSMCLPLAVNVFNNMLIGTRQAHEVNMTTQRAEEGRTNHRMNFETSCITYKLMIPQVPNIRSAAQHWAGLDDCSWGSNVLVSFTTGMGLGTDDATLASRQFRDLGGLTAFSYSTIVDEERGQDGLFDMMGLEVRLQRKTNQRVLSLRHGNPRRQHFRYFGPWDAEPTYAYVNPENRKLIRPSLQYGERFAHGEDFECEGLWNVSYDRVGPNGLPYSGHYLPRQGHAILSKISRKQMQMEEGNDDEEEDTSMTEAGSSFNHRCRSRITSFRNSGFVDSVMVTPNRNNARMVNVRVQHVLDIEPGNKTNSRHGQKGVFGAVLDPEKIIYNSKGIHPSIQVGPMALPSRETFSLPCEMLANRVAEACGIRIEGTLMSKAINKLLSIHKKYADSSLMFQPYGIPDAFERTLVPEEAEEYEMEKDDHKIRTFDYILRKMGFTQMTSEPHWSGRTGERLGGANLAGRGDVTVNAVYQSTLNRFSISKLQARSIGGVDPISRQGTDAKRFGEMERDSGIGHHASFFVDDRMFGCSDQRIEAFCTKCNIPIIANVRENIFYCIKCKANNKNGDLSNFGQYRIPHSFHVLTQLLRLSNLMPIKEFEQHIG